MVKISELKLPKIRKIIPFLNANGEKDSVTVYNIDEDVKESVIEIIKEHTSNDGVMEINGEDMLIKLFPLLTDIEIDVDTISDILRSPSKELILANSEIITIINEINMEMALNQNLEYERLLLLSEQIKGINMVAYLKDRMNSITPYRDFDPLNVEALEERDKRELEELRESYTKVKEIYEEAVKADKAEAESNE